MKFIKKNRKFLANKKTKVILNDVGKIILKRDELLNIQTLNKKNEICAKRWGFYLTPSLNYRLKKQNFLAVLTINKFKKNI